MGAGARPQFGLAKPMRGDTPTPAQTRTDRKHGGEQFPPLPETEAPPPGAGGGPGGDAMSRLEERMNSTHSGQSEVGGFEASVHKIKEQVLPRLLERVDPEAAATLTKDELSEEFRPIIMEVLAELKVTLNRREQFPLDKVLVD